MARSPFTKVAQARVLKALRNKDLMYKTLAERLESVPDPYAVKRWALENLRRDGTLKKDIKNVFYIVEWHRIHWRLGRLFWSLHKHRISAQEFWKIANEKTIKLKTMTKRVNFAEWLESVGVVWKGQIGNHFVNPLRRSKMDTWYVEGDKCLLRLETEFEYNEKNVQVKRIKHLKSIKYESAK